ncbi:MAG: TetR/AcrR family transcriptional regulator [Kofleriaceae bacterium]|nr:TetR/AcrR family transcriptional regulator [Kofleriaceae bacterium]
MPRTKEFDRDAALERAMQVFWGKGYAATSLDDLLKAMGIGRQSLYDTFGDKRQLFVAALDRYMAQSHEARDCLATSPTPKQAIREVFEQVVREPEALQRRGCLGIHTTLELAPTDPTIAKTIAAGQKKVEQAFHAALERAKELGEIPRSKDTRALARFLTGALVGLRVAATAEPHGAIVRDMVRITLQALD